MNPRILGVLAALLLVGGAALYFGSTTDPAEAPVPGTTPNAGREAPAANPATATPGGPAPGTRIADETPPSPPTAPKPATRAQAETALENARVAHTRALAEFEDAKVRLDDIEHEIAAVEGFVDDLEQRGEDPTQHAFEAFERLGPVMERLDELVINVEAAERRSQATARALAEAERNLGAFE